MRRPTQRGSISPVFMALLIFGLLLLGAFLDREWANYTMARAESLADFSAEAAAKTGAGYSTIHVERRQWFLDWKPICDQLDTDQKTCLVSHDEPFYYSVPDYPPDQEYKDTDLRQNWQQLLGCRRAAPGVLVMAPDWECTSVQVTGQRVEFPATVSDVARSTFNANWQNKSAARVVDLAIVPDSGNRTVLVQATLSVHSLLGIFPWEGTKIVQGAAVTQVDKMILQ